MKVLARGLRASDLLPLARAVVQAGGHLEFGVKGESMAPSLCNGDRVLLGPVTLAPGTVVLASLDSRPLLHRIERVEGERALLCADACRRSDWIPVEEIIGEVKAIRRGSYFKPLERRLRLSRLVQFAAVLLALFFARASHAQCVPTAYIVIDGETCDWTSAENPLVFNYNGGTGGIPLEDADVTDDYTTNVNGSYDGGNLYVLEQFVSGVKFAINDQVGLFLDIADGGPVDKACNANAALSFTCTANPCSKASDWSAIYYIGLDGGSCQIGEKAVTLNTTGTGRTTQEAAFALDGSNVEFGINFGAIGLPSTFLVAPYSTTNLNTNAQLSTLAQQAYSVKSVGPAGAFVTQIAARTEAPGVAIGWLTHGEFGTLGFAVYRARESAPPVLVDFQRGRIHAFEDWAYRVHDPAGRAGDRYYVADVDQHSGQQSWHGPAVASKEAGLPAQPALSRHPAPLLPSPPAPATASAAARFGVSSEGMYAIADSDLASMQIAIPAGAELTHAGTSTSFVRQAGLTLFYAAPISNRYDGVDGYIFQGGTPAARSGTALQPVPGQALAATVESHLHLKQNLSYDWDAPGENPYVWAWASNLFSPDPVTFDAPQAATSLQGPLQGNAELVAHLWGGTDQAHHVQLQLNGVALGEATWTGFTAVDLAVTVPAGLLQSSGNSLVLMPIFDTGAAYEFAMLESADLDYERLPLVFNGEARFTLPPATCVEVTGLGLAPEAWEITNPAAAIPLSGGGAPGSLTLCSPAAGSPRRYEVFDETAIHVPTVRSANPTLWAGTHHGADELIVAPPSLVAALQPLVEARRAQGLAVAVALLPDIDDAFQSGENGPTAIRSFLMTAVQSWQRPPRYVLLVGGANGDPLDLLGTGIPDLMPTAELVAGAFAMRSASDTWFVAGNDGVTPLAAIGRLPADSASQLETLVQKLLSGDSQGAPVGNALLVTDVPGAGDADFPLQSSVVEALLTQRGETVQAVSAGDANPAGEIAADLTAGADLWHYIGHGGTSSWGNDFLLSSDVLGFLNSRLPLLFTVDCLDGEFDNPAATPVGVAALMAPAGGSLASFVSSTVESPRDAHGFDLLVVRSLLTASASDRLGDVLLRAQARAASSAGLQAFVQTYNLLGDPASPVPLRTSPAESRAVRAPSDR